MLDNSKRMYSNGKFQKAFSILDAYIWSPSLSTWAVCLTEKKKTQKTQRDNIVKYFSINVFLLFCVNTYLPV